MSVRWWAVSTVTVKSNSGMAVSATVAASVGCWQWGCKSYSRSLSPAPSWSLLSSPLSAPRGASCSGQLWLLPMSQGWSRQTSCLFCVRPFKAALGSQLVWSLTWARHKGHPLQSVHPPCAKRGRANAGVSETACEHDWDIRTHKDRTSLLGTLSCQDMPRMRRYLSTYQLICSAGHAFLNYMTPQN